MKSNRRSVLIGLGALTVGGGAVFGTGAFSSVDADRTVSVNVANDSQAFLQLSAGDSDLVTDNDGTLEITLDGTDGTSNGNGINANAVTKITDAFTIGNQGTQILNISVDITDYGTNIGDPDYPSETDVDNAVDILVPDDFDTGTEIDLITNTANDIGNGTSTLATIEIDTNGLTDDTDDPFTGQLVNEITITAETQ